MSRANARRREFRGWLLGCVLVGLVFGLWPSLDLRLAGLFFDPAVGAVSAGFVHADQPLIWAVYKVVPWLGWFGALVGLLAWAWPALRRRQRGAWSRSAASNGGSALRSASCKAAMTPGETRWRRRLLTLLAVLVFGLLLAVNGVLKEGWGRPRPEHVGEFGGAKVFKPWWQPSRQCASNCSFVTGHGATGAALLGIGLLAPVATRRRWLATGWAAGLAIGLVRMIQGGHFASDVLFACLVIWGVGIAVRRVALVRRWRRWHHPLPASQP
jgi:membrane-associated phospholipid phosphatase